jgi:predicted PhzF superfamily epimerase YddE/YHI9
MESATAYRYRVVDVFTEHPLEGNPLAVFSAGSGNNAFLNAFC